MTRSTNISINIGGTDYPNYSRFLLNQRTDGHHSFEISVPTDESDKNKDYLGSKAQSLLGKQARFQFKGQSAGKTKEWTGKYIVTQVSLSRNEGSSDMLVIRGQSPTLLMENGLYTRSFLEKDVQKIASKVMEGYAGNELAREISPISNDEIHYIVQYKETNFQFLSRLAATYGEWFFYNGEKLYFGKAPSGDTIELNFGQGQNLSGFELGMRILPVTFSLSSQNYRGDGDNHVDISSDSVSVQGLGNDANFLLSESQKVFSQGGEKGYSIYQVKKNTELKKMAEKMKAARAGEMIVITGSSDNSQLKVGSVINVSGDVNKKANSYGNFIVTSITHSANSLASYRNQFEAIPQNVPLPPVNIHTRRPFAEAQPATVKDNNDDRGLGRIKVQFLWQEKNNEVSPWIRSTASYGGKERGFVFVPEVGDRVLVDFEQNNPDLPYVIGSLYHNDVAPKWSKRDKDNNEKAIKTRSGNQISFNDKNGEETIHIFNKEKQNEIIITLKDNGKITIKAKEKIELNAPTITMNAQKIEMTADKEMKIDAMKMETESKNYKLTSPQMKMEGQNLSIEAAKTSIKSSGMMELDGGGVMVVKGGIVKIN